MTCKVGVDKYSCGQQWFLRYSNQIFDQVPLYASYASVLFFNRHRARTGFDKSSLERLEQLFRKTVGNEKEIKREDFKKIVTSKNVMFELVLSFQMIK